ncbi:hypothetical protein SCP684_0016007600 [Saccharomyces cerevisiae]|nr:hypothetical protein SCP684_0016007600 [Saccharomyces cerevisiae]
MLGLTLDITDKKVFALGGYYGNKRLVANDMPATTKIVSLSEEPEVELLVGMTDDLDDSENIEVEVVAEEEMIEEDMTEEETTKVPFLR